MNDPGTDLLEDEQGVTALEWFPFALPHTFKIAKVTDPRALGINADEVEVTRELDLGLRLSARADSELIEAEAIPGTENTGITLLLDSSRGEITVFRRTGSQTTLEGGNRRSEVSGEIDSISFRFSENKCAKIVEWISNLPRRNWPDSTRRSPASSRVRRRRGETTGASEFRGGSVARDHIQLRLDLPTLERVVIGEVPEEYVTEGTEVARPGFIEYHPGPDGLPDERLRTTVRRAFEFLLGAGLGVLGHIEEDAEGRAVRLFFEAAYIAGGSIYPPFPPALLDSHLHDGLNAEILAPLVRKYIEKAPAWYLNDAVWRYLHSRNSPLEMAAGYVGGAWEAIRRGFFEMPEHEGRTRLLPNERWKVLAAALEDSMSVLAGQPEWQAFLEQLTAAKNRLPELNKVSGRKLNLKFLQDLGLESGETEDLALQARNNDAHAARISPSGVFKKLLEYRALQTLFSRALLAMLGAKVLYYDYSSVGHPLRALQQRQNPPG